MSLIHKLDIQTSNSIAAGEVVERPASVVKELCENSLDAKASIISIKVEKGGIAAITVVDNGQGMDQEDARLAFVAHATSKLSTISDLDNLQTMGFRGEALASIAAVSRVKLVTRQKDALAANVIYLEGSQIIKEEKSGAAVGTSITISDLFFNTPARFKFLKKDSAELAKITEVVQKLAMARPDVSFQLASENKTLIHTPGNNDLGSVVFSLFGRQIAGNLIDLDIHKNDEYHLSLTGVIGQPADARNNRNYQFVYVNNRPIKDPSISKAIDEAYRTRLMSKKYPFALLKIEMPPHLVDINVHPQKSEVRFWNNSQIFSLVYHAIVAKLTAKILPPGDWSNPEELSTVIIDADFNPQTSQPANTEILDSEIVHNRFDQVERRQSQSEVVSKSNFEYGNVDVVRPQTSGLNCARDNQFELKDDSLVNETVNSYENPSVEPHLEKFPSPSTLNPISDLDKQAEFKHVENESKANLAKTNEIKTDLPYNAGSTDPNTLPQTLPKIGVNDQDIVHRLSSLPMLGQIFATYIVVHDSDSLWLIDQHAAHEKVLFERFYQIFKDNKLQVQPLLIPITIELSLQDKILAMDNHSRIEKLGYEFDDFGDNSILLRGVPSQDYEQSPQVGFLAILDYLQSDHDSSKNFSWDFARPIIANIACKAAIKGNDPLDTVEMINLLKDLEVLDEPYNCPHGRPVIIRISKTELEKRFKRIL